MQYEAIFTRYSNETCNRDVSAPWFFEANDFTAAVDVAWQLRRGMAMADPGRDYEIVTIRGMGYHAVAVEAGGKTIWDPPEW